MGKRVVTGSSLIETHHQNLTPSSPINRKIRKRKGNADDIPGTATCIKTLRMNASNNIWRSSSNDDSSSNETSLMTLPVTPHNYNITTKHGNNHSIKLNNSFDEVAKEHNNSSITESPKPIYTLRPSIVNGTVLCDLTQKCWRLGKPIGKGNFGEIFLASDNITTPVTHENAKFVVKIEPHSNGPLFVEIHCLMNTANNNSDYKQENSNPDHNKPKYLGLPQNSPSGIPNYIASGSHKFGDARYRFLVLPRFDRDLHSLIKNSRVHQKSVLTLAIQIINVLEKLHNSGYCHNDVKAQNLMISKCKYLNISKSELQQEKQGPRKQEKKHTLTKCKKMPNSKESKIKKCSSTAAAYKDKEKYEEKQQTTDSGNSSEQEMREEEDEDNASFVLKRRVYNNNVSCSADEEDEDFDDGATTTNSSSIDTYRTPTQRPQRRLAVASKETQKIEFSGSNPVRSCRRQRGHNSIYEEMIKSHYLRPTKRISYSEFFNEDGASVKGDSGDDDEINSNKDVHSNSSDDDSDEFMPPTKQRRSYAVSAAKMRCNTNLTSCRRLTRRQEKLLANNSIREERKRKSITERHSAAVTLRSYQHSLEQRNFCVHEQEHIFLIDYGLASKYTDNGVHRPFVMDQRRAHDGTLEFTSRDAHMGAHSRRSDLECLGYNLLLWSQGYLPWKEAATNQQPEKVHRAKEYLMLNVREILREIYGQQVPKFLGEFLYLVGQLSYNERPDYERYKRLFEQEYKQLGYKVVDMRLSIEEIERTCVRIKSAEVGTKTDFFKVTKADVGGAQCVALNIMHNLSVGSTPLHERTITNRISPKNLRSKSSKKAPAKTNFSWVDILSQDPDQIARERAEKEFELEETLNGMHQPQQQLVRKYQGKPTYAIKEILARLKQNGRTIEEPDIKHSRQQQLKWNLHLEDERIKANGNVDYRTRDNCEQISARVEIATSHDNLRRKLNKKTPLNTPAPVQTSTPIGLKTRGKRCLKNETTTVATTTTRKSRKAQTINNMHRQDKQVLDKSHKGNVSLPGTQHNNINDSPKKTRRTRRCLMKTDLQQADVMFDDRSNSNINN